MARIRSIHPGLWTDETFVTLSDAAKVFYLGLLTEADDYGAFEWKPVTLKMRLLPASTSTAEPILAELAAANKVTSYEHEGRQYGAIRNFCRYQRPKKPKSLHFMPPEFRTYVGSSAQSSEPETVEPTSVPKKEEIGSQMEDGGWKEITNKPPSPGASGGVGLKLVSESDAPPPDLDGIPEVLDRRTYPADFEDLWREYRPIAEKNATKADAFRAWGRLSKPDKSDCWRGLVRYVQWLIEARKKRSDTPAKHSATFINRRGWEPYMEDEVSAHAI